MVRESRKKANAKWDKENMTVIGCRIRRDRAEAFKAICAASGTNPNAVFLAVVKATLENGTLAAQQAGDTP